MANVIRLKHISATKLYLNAWMTGKVCCTDVKCEGIIFELNGICHHYRIMHDICQNAEKKIMAGKKLLCELAADETMKSLKMLSDMSMRQVRIVV